MINEASICRGEIRTCVVSRQYVVRLEERLSKCERGTGYGIQYGPGAILAL